MITKILVGLGNPDKHYEHTRHNAGFMALDQLAEANGLEWKENKKFNSLVATLSQTLLLKPQTYMNNSGQAVRAALSYYKLLPKNLLSTKKDSDLNEVLTVIHDDLDINLGKYKISTDSRSAGHNGVQSIIDHLKTKNFKRIRIGILTELKNKMPGEKFVLDNFGKKETLVLEKVLGEVMNELNG
jgi:peptidyl-tRNA hydrolase, PTH1 family